MYYNNHMPNRYKVNCATCIMSKKDVPLRTRIRYAAYKREQGDETLYDIADAVGLTRHGIYNHVKKHMEDISDRYINRSRVQAAKKVAEVRTKVQKEAELFLDPDTVDAIEGRPLEIVALDDYIAQAKAMIDNKELKITASTFLAATKIKTDWQRGQQSNKTEFLKAIYAMASGATKAVTNEKEVIDVGTTDTSEDATGDDTGKEQPTTIYGAITGPIAS